MRTVVAVLTLGTLGLAGTARAADLRYLDDAAIRALHFADDKEGWAAGDEGVIWHTLDGGKTWERQATGTRASLRSIFFLPKNPFVGWVAGREELPHDGGSVGVLLVTNNGGGTWQRLLVNAMPGLNKVVFTDAKTGYVLGDGSDQFPTGVFKTKDGGRLWEPVPGPRMPGWLGGDFLTGQTGILAGAWDRLATFRLDVFHPANIESLGGRNINSVFVFDRRALAVGEGGLVLTSTTQGATWGYANNRLKLSDDALANVDLHSVHGAGKHAWAVGRPGSIVLHSPDQGASWQVQRTGQSVPLHAVFFVDEKRGWAAGELGSILATTDGGKSWQAQHQGGKRAALLAVHARPEDMPVDTFARLGAEEGYLTAAVRVAAPDPASAALSQAGAGQRLAMAARQAGAAAGEMLWQFPLPQHLGGTDKAAILTHWNQLHGKAAEKQFLRQLVLAVRTWRPDVIITDHPDAKVTENAAGALTAEALHEAVSLAADTKAFPEQIEELGLTAWRVTKLYGAWDKRAGSHAVVDSNEARVRLEGSAADYTAFSASILTGSSRSSPRQRFYRLLNASENAGDKQSHLMAGIALEPGGEARRRLPPEPAKETLKPYRIRRDLEILAANVNEPARTLAQIGPLLTTLPEDQGAAAALSLANLYMRQGQWALARETFLMMVDRYPAHPLSAEAYGWLIRHISSSEARRRHELEQFVMMQKAAFFTKPGIPENEKKKPLPESSVVQQTRLTYLADKQEARQWYRGSLEFGKRLAGYGPLYASDPGTQFCLQASRRNLGEFEEARGWYQKFRTHFPQGPWHDAAAAELWLDHRQGPPPKPVALCRRADTRPFLDGKLDDACWQGKPLVLGDAVNKTGSVYQTEVRFAHDQEYLYVALCCKHPAGPAVPPVKKRKHDEDLRRFDRVSIMLDLDRDYATYFHLQVDQRGCLFEDCWGDASWNPRWFVAVDSTEDCWQIEAAVPLTELTADRIRGGTAWAVNVVRILPGRGVQAFSLPADLEPRPQGMGLLLFN